MKNGHKLIIGIVVLLLVIILVFQASGFMNSSNNSTNNTTQSSENDTNSQVSQKTSTNTQKTDQVSQQQNTPTPETKSAICSVCNGKGYWNCKMCGGSGIDPITQQKCQGDQFQCVNGRNICPSCGGDGRMDPGDMGPYMN